VGTLLAFTTVAVSVLIIRYVPPDEVPIPSSLLSSVDQLLGHSGGHIGEDMEISPVDPAVYCEDSHLHDKSEALLKHPLIIKEVTKGNCCLNLQFFCIYIYIEGHPLPVYDFCKLGLAMLTEII